MKRSNLRPQSDTGAVPSWCGLLVVDPQLLTWSVRGSGIIGRDTWRAVPTKLKSSKRVGEVTFSCEVCADPRRRHRTPRSNFAPSRARANERI
jgi:hypothetical protein